MEIICRAVVKVNPDGINTACEQLCLKHLRRLNFTSSALGNLLRSLGTVTVMGRFSSFSAAAFSGAAVEVGEASERELWPCKSRRCFLSVRLRETDVACFAILKGSRH